MINRFVELEHFVGFDWATQKHAIVAVNGAGEIVLQLEFLDTGPGWEQLRQALMPLGKFAVAIETSRGPEVERLLAMQVTVYPVNPSSAKAYRTRKAPSGVKDDLLDAYSLGDALRTDGSQWKSLSPEDPQTQLLRLLCRDEMALIEQRTAFVHQLTAAGAVLRLEPLHVARELADEVAPRRPDREAELGCGTWSLQDRLDVEQVSVGLGSRQSVAHATVNLSPGSSRRPRLLV